jgi:putative ABC transport system permease protein
MSERRGLAGLVVRMATRQTGRLSARLLAMALISFVLVGLLLLGQGIARESARAAGRLGADIMIVPKGTGTSGTVKLIGGLPVGSVLPKGLEERITAMGGVSRIAPQYVVSSAADPCCELGQILLVGFDPSRDFTVLPWLRPEDRRPEGTRQLLAGGRVMKAPGAAMRFFDHTFTLTARLEQSRASTFDTALFVPLEGLAAMERSSRSGANRLTIPWGRPSLLFLKLAAGTEPRHLALALERQYPGIQALPIGEAARSDRLRLENLASGGAPLAATAWLFALLAGGTVLFSNLQTRRTSLGLLHCYGYGTGLLAAMFALETFAISLSGMIAGGVAALFALWFSDQYLATALGVPLLSGWLSRSAVAMAWSFPAFAGALGITTALGVFLVLRREPADLLRGNR